MFRGCGGLRLTSLDEYLELGPGQEKISMPWTGLLRLSSYVAIIQGHYAQRQKDPTNCPHPLSITIVTASSP
jgi:hypothetical protein